MYKLVIHSQDKQEQQFILSLTTARKFAKDLLENNQVDRVDIYEQVEVYVDTMSLKPSLVKKSVVVQQKEKEY